ncbi:MAG: hypothetical protein KAV83_02565 [Desulfobacterales bacterium]|nr:hypothetical protein [Desulfobacterales bacterium]
MNKNELAGTLNHLLVVEGEKLGIPPTEIHTTLRISDPDAGVDARVQASEVVQKRWIPPGLSVWQYKSGGRLNKKDFEDEFNKPGVQEAIKSGGVYCLVWGKGCADKARKKKEKWLRECFESINLKPKFTFFDADKVARWASERPAVAIHDFKARAGDLVLWQEWASQGLHQVPFHPDPQRNGMISQMRAELQQKDRIIHFRIEGLAGVGKTKLVLEAFRGETMSEKVLYASSPRDIPQGFFFWIAENTQIETILVVDECDKAACDMLAQQAERSACRIVLVTIRAGQIWSRDTASMPEAVLYVQKLRGEELEKIVKDISPSIHTEAARFVARLSSGYVKLAVRLAEALARNPQIADARTLAGDYEIAPFLEAMIPGRELRNGMRAVSLLRRIGWERELAQEGKAVSDFMGIKWGRLQDIVEEMFRQGLVAKQGRYRYVTPHILAVWLAGSVWDSRGDSILDLLERLPTPESKRAMLERLGDLGDHEKVHEVVQRMLGKGGLFRNLRNLENKQASNIFYTLAMASPSTGIEALERLILQLPREKLQDFRHGRRNIVWFLEKMAWHKEWFFRAGWLVLILAEGESENFSNNATAVWTGFFLTHLGGTAVPAIERFRLLEEALGSESVERRILAVKALRAVFSLYETRSGGAENQAGRLVPPEWRPGDYREHLEVWKAALDILDRAIADRDQRVAREARSVLLGSARSLVKMGLAEGAFSRIERLETDSEEDRRDVRETLQWIMRFESKILSRAHQERLKGIIQGLEGKTFHERLRRWCGCLSSADMPLEKERERILIERAEKLAEEAFKNPGLLREEMEWLTTPDARHVWPFARKLGELDESAEWLETLVRIARSGKGEFFLAWYLKGRVDAGAKEWVENILDKWSREEEHLGVAIFECTWREGASEQGVKKLIGLVDSGKLPPGTFGSLVWGDWTKKLSVTLFKEILCRLMTDESPRATEAALAMVHRRMETHEADLEAISPMAWQLLERSCPMVKTQMIGYHWEKIAELILHEDPLRMAGLILSSLGETEEIFIRGNHPLNILAIVSRANPRKVWKMVGEILLQDDSAAIKLKVMLQRWYGDLIDTDYLLEWAEKNKPNGPYIAASLASIGGARIGELPRELLTRYEEEYDVGSVLVGNYLSGSFSGSYASCMERKLKEVREWTKDGNPAVRRWAEKLARGLEKDIKQARLREEERGF